MTLGYIGLGNMGAPLAKRLQLKHPLHVYDRNALAMHSLAGVKPCAGIADLSVNCDVIFLCLPTSKEVRSVIFDGEGIASKARRGTLIVDQTTGDPLATRQMASELAPFDMNLIDCPVSGGPRSADAGTVALMVGAALPQYERVLPLLQSISSNIFHVGDVGAGQVLKLVNNMLHHTQRLISLEAIALAAKNGINPRSAVDAILAGSGRNYFVEHHLKPRILAGNFDASFTMGLAHKDVLLATQLASISGVPMMISSLVREFYSMCVNELGQDAQANSAALVIDRIAGTNIVPASSG